MRRHRSLLSLALLTSTLAACDGTTGPVLEPDAGVDARVEVDGGPDDAGAPDAPAPDDVRPTVVATDPDDGARGVAATAPISITFSEPIASGGTISASAGGAPVALGAPAWDAARTTVTITPEAPLPSESRVRVTIGDDFADDAGNTLALPLVLTFDVADVAPPVVTGSDPAQGATGLSARTDAIVVTFSETMDASAGTATLSGGAGTIGAPEWIDGRRVRFALEGLAYATSYSITLDGFADGAGNALDPATYLVEGAIGLTTGPDVDVPHVIDSVPAEGQVNVALRGTPSVVLVFDEAMDTSAGTATLSALGSSSVLAGTWSDGDRTLTLPIAGRLYPSAPHSIALAGFRDVAGNALDPIAYLADGALDFDTGADATVPIVVFSYPNEGSTDATHRLAQIEVAFDRAMDTSITTLRVDDGVAPFDAPVTWNLAGTRAYLDVTNRIHAGRTHHVDLRGMIDLAGDPVDPDAPYLGDGVLDFTTRAPTGEQCRDELGIDQATGRTAGGGYEWVIPETSMAIADNGPVCRYAGAPSTSYSPDAVVLYRKSTAAGSSGGRYLHVTAETAGPTELSANRVTLAVYRDACAEASPGGPDARLACQWDRFRWEQYLDVGAGDYYLWVASVDSSVQDRITVRVEEVDAVPAGETCAAPYTADPALSVYTPPSAPGGEHVWTIPGLEYHGADMDDAWPGSGAIACDADQVQGTDFVIEFDKESDTSLVSVVAERTDGNVDHLHVEALSVCDPRRADATSYAATCGMRTGSFASAGPRRITFAAPAGAVYVWGATDQQRSRPLDATIRIQEFPNDPGTSCANAIRIPASGSTTITPSSLARLGTPSCMTPQGSTGDDARQADGITWYRLTASEVATVLRTDVAGTPAGTGAIAIVDASSGRELGCGIDATQVPMAAIVPRGADVCIAVRNSSGIGRLDLAQVPYSGVRGVPTDLGITRPLGTSGSEISITGDQWMVATPTTLYMALSSSLIIAPRAGAARADQRTLTTGQIGSAGVAIGEALWSLDDSSSSGTASRFFRVVDAAGAAGVTSWDTGTSWPGDSYDSLAYDGAAFFVANDYASTVPVAVRRLDPAAPGAAIAVGTLHASFRDTLGMAADATWLYFAAAVQVDATTTRRGVFRVRRSDLAMVPEPIATLPMFTSATSTTLVARVPMAVDSTASAAHLYVRAGDGSVHAIVDPGGAAPVHVGPISTLGTYGDFAMAYDPAGPSIYLFETESVSTGAFVRLD